MTEQDVKILAITPNWTKMETFLWKSDIHRTKKNINTDAPSENGVLCKEAYQAVNKTEVITAIWTLLGNINMPITIRTSNLKAQIVLYSAFKTEV